ncbi:flagellin [Stutzerimonas stutzeri]|nr:flagellin [Stutzerimonas stutzeri]
MAKRDAQIAAGLQSQSGSAAIRTTTAEQAPASILEARSAAEAFKSFVQDIQRNLDFSVDDSTGQVVVKVIDGDSGKLVRQIPSEELLRLSERLDDMRSLLFKAEA